MAGGTYNLGPKKPQSKPTNGRATPPLITDSLLIRVAQFVAMALPLKEISKKTGVTRPTIEKMCATERGQEVLAAEREKLSDKAAWILACAKEHAPGLLLKTIEEAMDDARVNPYAWSQRKWLLEMAGNMNRSATHLHLEQHTHFSPELMQDLKGVIAATEARRQHAEIDITSSAHVIEGEEALSRRRVREDVEEEAHA